MYPLLSGASLITRFATLLLFPATNKPPPNPILTAPLGNATATYGAPGQPPVTGSAGSPTASVPPISTTPLTVPPIDKNPGIPAGAPAPALPVPGAADASNAPGLIGQKPDQPPLMLHFWTSEWETNTYVLISRRKKAVVIDPGDWMEPLPDDHWGLTGKHTAPLIKVLKNRGIEVKLVISTHGHLDHVSGMAALKEAFPHCSLCMAPADLDADGRPKDSHMFPGGLPRVDHRLKDGETLTCDGIRLKVIYTPGHSPGSISLLCGDWLFSGDTLFLSSVGRTNFRDGSGNWDQEMASIRNRLYTLPPATLVLPGHFDFTTISAEKDHNPFTTPAPGAPAGGP